VSDFLFDNKMRLAVRFSLAFLWLFTALTSVFFAREEGFEILARGGISGVLAEVSIYSGSLLDAIIGIWLLVGRRLDRCYLIQLWVIICYSILLTIIDADFWLHPFGPLTKNIPILILVYLFYSYERAKVNNASS
jgi:hypothetical protein